MKRLALLASATVLTAAVLSADIASAQQQSSPARGVQPNIGFVLMDNLGYGEVGCYGGGVTRGAPTPRIDKFAMEGTRLTNFNVEAQYTPSRSAILTGAALAVRFVRYGPRVKPCCTGFLAIPGSPRVTPRRRADRLSGRQKAQEQPRFPDGTSSCFRI